MSLSSGHVQKFPEKGDVHDIMNMKLGIMKSKAKDEVPLPWRGTVPQDMFVTGCFILVAF